MSGDLNEIYAGGVPLFGADWTIQPNGYTPKSAIPKVLYSGSVPVAQSYENVEEPFEIFVMGADSNETVLNKRTLELALTTALYSQPAILKVRARDQTQTGYAEIYSVRMQEGPEFIGRETGARVMRLSGTWVRSPFFSAGALTTLQSGITVTNTGTGANNNTRALGTLTGDLVQEGSPLTISLAGGSGGFRYMYLATVYQRIYSTSPAGSVSTSSTTGAAAWTDSTATITDPARTRNGLRLRVLVRATTLSQAAEVRMSLLGSTSQQLWVGPWVPAPTPVGAGPWQLDVTPQGVPMDVIRKAAVSNGDLTVGLTLRSADGTNVTLVTHSVQFLLYYTFCRVQALTDVGTSDTLQIEQASDLNGSIWLPTPGCAYATASGVITDVADVRGALPRAYTGASLWMSWLNSSFQHTNTATSTVTTKLLPLFRTLRGAI